MTVPSIIDTHAHLDMSAYNQDLEETLARASEAGVVNTITVGIDLASSKKAVELAERYPNVYASVGIHPHDVAAITMSDIDAIAKVGMSPKVVAIGETGLDFYRDACPRDRQTIAFLWHLDMAEEMGLPVIIHSRQATAETIELLQNRRAANSIGHYRGVLHCFNGDADTAKTYLNMGFHISLGGYITYPKTNALHNIIKTIPDNRLLAETDCPFLPPQDFRGKRNEPSYLCLTIEKLAEIRNQSYEHIARVTTENARRLFGIPE